jgi:hypothetical protein
VQFEMQTEITIIDAILDLLQYLWEEIPCLLLGLVGCPILGCCSFLGSGLLVWLGLYPLTCGVNICCFPFSFLCFIPTLGLTYLGEMFNIGAMCLACCSFPFWLCVPCGVGVWSCAMGCLSLSVCSNATGNILNNLIIGLCPLSLAPCGIWTGLLAKVYAIPLSIINIPCVLVGFCCGLPLTCVCPCCPVSASVFCDWGCWHGLWELGLLVNVGTLCVSFPEIIGKALAGCICPCCWI